MDVELADVPSPADRHLWTSPPAVCGLCGARSDASDTKVLDAWRRLGHSKKPLPFISERFFLLLCEIPSGKLLGAAAFFLLWICTNY